jgi:predicted HAD superfamily phosphohydrolase
MKILTSLLIISTLFLTACPKESAVRKAAKASYQLSGLTRDVVAATGRAYDEQIISTETKNRIADKLKLIAIGGQKFNTIVATLDKSDVPFDKRALLNQILNDEIAAPFLEILEALKVVSAAQASHLHNALSALRIAILTISAAVSQHTHDRFLDRSQGAQWAIS